MKRNRILSLLQCNQFLIPDILGEKGTEEEEKMNATKLILHGQCGQLVGPWCTVWGMLVE